MSTFSLSVESTMIIFDVRIIVRVSCLFFNGQGDAFFVHRWWWSSSYSDFSSGIHGARGSDDFPTHAYRRHRHWSAGRTWARYNESGFRSCCVFKMRACKYICTQIRSWIRTYAYERNRWRVRRIWPSKTFSKADFCRLLAAQRRFRNCRHQILKPSPPPSEHMMEDTSETHTEIWFLTRNLSFVSVLHHPMTLRRINWTFSIGKLRYYNLYRVIHPNWNGKDKKFFESNDASPTDSL